MTVRSRYAGLAALALLAACGSKTDVDNLEAAATINAEDAEHDADTRAEALDAQADLLNGEANRIGGAEGAALDNRAAADEKAADEIVKRGEAKAKQIEDASENALQNKQ